LICQSLEVNNEFKYALLNGNEIISFFLAGQILLFFQTRSDAVILEL